jgi:DNA modification methylase
MTKTKSTPIKANPPAMRVSDLTPNPRNPRKITDDKLAMLRREMEEFGDLSGIVLNTTSGHLVGGHQRVKNFDPAWEVRKTSCTDKTGTVAKGIIITPYGEWTYREVSWSANKEYLANIAANKQLAEFDMYEVNQIFQEFKGSDLDLTLSGFEVGEIEGLFSEYGNEVTADESDDDVPEIDESNIVCKTGDLWSLGKHRLLCGDCLIIDNVDRLLDGNKIDIVFTDPPYGVSYANKNTFLNEIDKGNRNQREIKNDHQSEKDIQVFWKAIFEVIRDRLNEYNSYYITGPQIQGMMMMMMMMMMQEAGLPYRHVIIWVKNNHVLGRCDYNYKHEPIFFGWITKHKFYGNGEIKTSVWEVDKPLKNDLHPTMKPIALMENALLNSSEKGMICFDPFLGSGSTLIACEKTDRICYGIEIEPYYCDIIIKRWEDYTGEKARLIK